MFPMRCERLLIPVVVSLLCMMLTGCMSTKVEMDPIVLETTGPIGVDVQSFNGDVYVRAEPRYEQTIVQLVARATHGFGRDAEADYSLDQVKYDLQIVPGDLGQVLQIVTTTDHPEPYFQRADVYIYTSDVENVSIRTTNGDVVLRGIRGRTEVRTSHGDVRLMTARPMTEPVTVINKNGDIVYRVRGESSAIFDCETVRGEILGHRENCNFVLHAASSDRALNATLNSGRNPVILRTTDGDIIVSVVPDPEQVGRMINE
jgi:hypothetical protein